MISFLLYVTVGVHVVCAVTGGFLGAAEFYRGSSLPWTIRYFSLRSDDLYTASARGLVRGLFIPSKVLSQVPSVWEREISSTRKQ